MFSFAKIATVAALAFGAFTSAMPTGVQSRAVEARGATDLSGILADLHVGIQADVDLLGGVTKDNYSYDHVNGIVLDIKAKVDAAVGACKKLPAGAIGSGDILALVSVILNLVLIPCGKIYAFVDVDAQVALKACFSVLGDSLASLVSVVLGLVLGLLGGVLSIVVGLLVSLLGGCRSTILDLHLTALINLLHL